MAKYKYILTVIIILCTITTYAQPAQYTPMTASGYQMKRLKVDSTLHLPSFCGVPNLRGSVVKEGALAIDTCGGLLYMWTNLGGWDTINVTGGDGGNQDLQSVLDKGNSALNKDINLYGKTTNNQIYLSGLDNSNMPFFALVDSIGGGLYQYTYPQATIEFINKSMNQKLKQQDSIRGTIYLPSQISDATDTLAMLSDVRSVGTIPTLQQVTDSGATTTNTISVNSLNIGATGTKINLSGVTNNLTIYNEGTSDEILNVTNGATGSLKFGGGAGQYVQINVSQNGNVELTAPSTDGIIPISVNGNTADAAGNITITSTLDTTNQFVKRLDRTPGKDSIIYFVGANRFAIKDSVGTGGSSQNGRFGNDTATVVMVKVHNDAGVTLTNGKVVALTTSGNNNEAPAVRLANNKGDSTSANTLGFVSGTIANQDTGWVILSGKIEKLNTSAFSNGDIIYLDSVNGNWTKTKPTAPYHMVYLGVVVKSNAGNGSIFVKAQNGYELDEIHDVKITSPLNNQILAYSDTQRLWKNRNIYSIVDTTSLSNRINLKQNSSLTSYSFLANNTSATANGTAQVFKDTTGTFTGSIAWTGTTAPSGATNHSYRLTQVGKCVTLNISLVYATNGSGLSQVLVGLPSGAPTPAQPAGLTSASQHIYVANAQFITSANLTQNIVQRTTLRNNASNGFEFISTFVSVTAAQANITCQYWTN